MKRDNIGINIMGYDNGIGIPDHRHCWLADH